MLHFSMPTLGSFNLQLTPRRSKFLLALLLGLSASAAIGLLLRFRRRRYRAIQLVASSLRRSDTFCESGREDASGVSRDSSCSHTPNELRTNKSSMIKQEGGGLSPSITQESSAASAEFVDADKVLSSVGVEERVDGGALVRQVEEEMAMEEERVWPAVSENQDVRRSSVSSNDSFYSAEGDEDLSVDLYTAARRLVQRGEVKCRKNRAALLGCEDEQDFLTKLHCVRQAFERLVQTPTYRSYFVDITRELMTSILVEGNQDPAPFLSKFKDLTDFLEDEQGWEVTKRELASRKVVCVNVYDVALDFVLLDAFDDMQNPPATLVNILQNRWLTESLKISGITTIIWAVSKTKKGLLKTKNGFMFRFYSLSETISPVLAWGFMGTNSALREKCHSLKTKVTDFVQSTFSRERVNYSSVDSLAEDVLQLAREMVQSMQT